jgi:hypothetical protein
LGLVLAALLLLVRFYLLLAALLDQALQAVQEERVLPQRHCAKLLPLPVGLAALPEAAVKLVAVVADQFMGLAVRGVVRQFPDKIVVVVVVQEAQEVQPQLSHQLWVLVVVVYLLVLMPLLLLQGVGAAGQLVQVNRQMMQI